MRTPSACNSFTSDAPARNQRSSASTERNARRFVVTAGKPSLMRKRMTSPKIARVPVPVRSSRSTPWSMALRRMSRYCRTGLVCRGPVDPASDAHPAHFSAVAEEFAARVLQRPVEQRELLGRGERDARRRRILRRRVVLQLVVRERAVDEAGVGDLELGIRELGGVAAGELGVARA